MSFLHYIPDELLIKEIKQVLNIAHSMKQEVKPDFSRFNVDHHI